MDYDSRIRALEDRVGELNKLVSDLTNGGRRSLLPNQPPGRVDKDITFAIDNKPVLSLHHDHTIRVDGELTTDSHRILNALQRIMRAKWKTPEPPWDKVTPRGNA